MHASTRGGQKKVSDPLEPKIHADAGNQGLVLWMKTVLYLQPMKQSSFLKLTLYDAFQYSRLVNAC